MTVFEEYKRQLAIRVQNECNEGMDYSELAMFAALLDDPDAKEAFTTMFCPNASICNSAWIDGCDTCWDRTYDPVKMPVIQPVRSTKG